jgi:hypothetical protein
VAVVLVVLVGDDTETTTRPFGAGEVTLSVDPDESTTDQLREVILQTSTQAGFPTEVVECFRRELEEIPDSEFSEVISRLPTLSETERFEASLPFRRQLAQECASKEELRSFDIKALDENQAALLQEGALREIEQRMIVRQGLPPRLAACVVDRFRQISPDAFLELNEAPPRVIERTFIREARKCR